jgi:hypothetical protein
MARNYANQQQDLHEAMHRRVHTEGPQASQPPAHHSRNNVNSNLDNYTNILVDDDHHPDNGGAHATTTEGGHTLIEDELGLDGIDAE